MFNTSGLQEPTRLSAAEENDDGGMYACVCGAGVRRAKEATIGHCILS